jgi:hypothetical protein
MTDQEKIKVLAELDGWKEPMSYPGSLPRYLTSYDAIIPLVKKCWEGRLFEPDKFYKAIPNYYPHILTFIQHTSPQELADALIKAVGKWKD